MRGDGKLTSRARILYTVRMSRPPSLAFPILLVVLTTALAGCSTIYDDMYSPRRSRFVPPPEKTTTTTTLLEAGPIPAGDTTPSNPVPSTAPAAVPTMPAPAMDPGATPLPSGDPAAAPMTDPAAPPMTGADPAMGGADPAAPGSAPAPVPGLEQ